jgi:hypothetical protein
MRNVVVSDRAELIRWADAHEGLAMAWSDEDVERGLTRVRACRTHPDALWLASLFPAGAAVTLAGMLETMVKLTDDRRALFFATVFDKTNFDVAPMARAAKLGYAPAQARMSAIACGRDDFEEAFRLAEDAALQGDRRGLYLLGLCYLRGQGCEVSKAKAIEFFRKSAELECAAGQYWYGKTAFKSTDWKRYHWTGRAAAQRGDGNEGAFCHAIVLFLPELEEGRHGRVLHTVAQVVRAHFDDAARQVFGRGTIGEERRALRRVVVLHTDMLGRARAAIMCLSLVGLRRGLVKDVRVMIAKMAWEDAWRWSERQAKRAENAKAEHKG